MNYINKIKTLLNFIKYTSKGFSPCKIYQTLELKKLKIQDTIIEFGTNNYEESFTKLIRKKTQKIFFSNLKKFKSKNYIKINLEKKNNFKKKFDNIIIFNVLEHIYNEKNALRELNKILKKNGKIYISTPFLYRYHEAPEDYKRYTITYFEKVLKEKKFKSIIKKNLGEGPLMASYSMLFDYINKVPLISYPILIICFLFDQVLSCFHKTDIKKLYPICILIIASKK